MNTREITCIGCPMGCRIKATVENGKILSLDGYSCAIGKKYAKEELTLPTRMVTSLVSVKGSNKPISVKLSKPIDKKKISKCLQEIKSKEVMLPVHTGDIIIKGVCSTDINVIATKDLN